MWWQGWLAEPDAGDRLQYASVTGLAPAAHWQGEYGISSSGASPYVRRVIRTLKEQCVHRHRFESQTHALRIIVDWSDYTKH
ncbi:hypothetical protein GCM10027214_04380 [Stenotrophomonas tumulicola]